jgi:N-acetylmuramoyl-L-alanine amidase CwlA
MTYPIIVNLIAGLPKQPFRKGVGAYEGVVNHSTATPEADDIRERSWEAAHWKDAFVHFFVDWDSITQVASTQYRAWGAGANANPRFVHVELCETKDSAKFQESYKRYVWLTAKLLKDRNLGVSDAGSLWSHAEVTKLLKGTTHTDPIAYLASHGISWAQHAANVQAEYNGGIPYKVIIPNTAFWQAKGLVQEFEGRGYTCYGHNLKNYTQGQVPADADPYQFIIETSHEEAVKLVIELQQRGYDRAFGEAI